MSFSGLVQFVLGFFLGVLLLAGSSAAAAFFLLSGLSTQPPRPVFPEEQTNVPTEEDAAPPTEENEENAEAAIPTPSAQATLAPGTYKAKVTWSQGLSLRGEPNESANRVGGLAYDQEVIVLQDNENKQWHKVRATSSNQEGWVKAGNIQKID